MSLVLQSQWVLVNFIVAFVLFHCVIIDFRSLIQSNLQFKERVNRATSFTQPQIVPDQEATDTADTKPPALIPQDLKSSDPLKFETYFNKTFCY